MDRSILAAIRVVLVLTACIVRECTCVDYPVIQLSTTEDNNIVLDCDCKSRFDCYWILTNKRHDQRDLRVDQPPDIAYSALIGSARLLLIDTTIDNTGRYLCKSHANITHVEYILTVLPSTDDEDIDAELYALQEELEYESIGQIIKLISVGSISVLVCIVSSIIFIVACKVYT